MHWQIQAGCVVDLQTGNETVRASWRSIIGDRLIEEPAAAPEIAIRVRCRLEDTLPDLPDVPPIFVDPQGAAGGDFGNLSVYGGREGEIVLSYLHGGLAWLNFDRVPPTADLWVTRKMVASPRFEDVLFTSLAPHLRRGGLFMVHAFAAAHAQTGGAVLLVGPSGSGKTTTGLKLLLSGWRLLANDIVLVRQAAGEVLALPTPGIISVRRPTLELLPALQRLTAGEAVEDLKLDSRAIKRWSGPAPVRAIFFPSVAASGRAALAAESASVALARLMEESLDRWDDSYLEPHAALLGRLVDQAATYRLELGRDLDQIIELIG